MAAYTKIVDLFGVPACGKTTLAEYLSKNSQADYKIASIQNIVTEAKKNKTRFILSISLKTFFSALRVRCAAPFNKKRRDITLRGWLLLDLLFNFAKKYSQYDMVLVDHGVIQSFVSLERGDNLHEKPKFANACSHYVDISPITTYVFCQIDAQNAMERMHNRNRNVGRIDVINDERIQLLEIENESQRFDFYAKMLKEKQKEYLELNMAENVENVAEHLLLKIKYK